MSRRRDTSGAEAPRRREDLLDFLVSTRDGEE